MSLELGAMLGLSSSGPGRQHLHLPRREILDRDHEAPAVATHEHEALAVRRGVRRDVVAAVERHSLDGARGDRQPVDLRRAAAIGGEQQRPAVRRERGLGVDAGRVEEALDAGAVGVDQEDLRAAVLGERHREPAAVRRPRGRAVAAAEIREHLPLAGGHRLHVDDGLLVLHRDVGDAASRRATTPAKAAARSSRRSPADCCRRHRRR